MIKFDFKKPVKNPESGGYYFLRKNSYWIVNEEGEIAYYKNSPQCNISKSVMDNYLKRTEAFQNCTVEFFENIFEEVPQSQIKGF